MKPHVLCHMLTSLDGRIHPSRWTQSSDGDRKVWSSAYEKVHETLAGDAWLLMAAGVVDELSILIAPALDGALGITGVFEVADPRGLAGKARLHLTSTETLEHGLVHLRYAVETT